MRRAEPDERVQDHPAPIGDMQELVARLLAVATDPVDLALAEVIEEREAEIAQIKEEQAAPGDLGQQVQHIQFAVAQGLADIVQAQPALRPDVEESGQLAGQQSRVTLPMLPLPGQAAYHGIQPGLVQGQDARGKGGQLTGRGRHPGGQAGSQAGKQLLQGGQARLAQAQAQGSGGDAHRGKTAQRPRRQQARQSAIAAQSFQHRPQQPQPQVVGCHCTRAATPSLSHS